MHNCMLTVKYQNSVNIYNNTQMNKKKGKESKMAEKGQINSEKHYGISI